MTGRLELDPETGATVYYPTSIQERYGTHPSHRFAPDWDRDNIECVYCTVRPYHDDAKRPCPDHEWMEEGR